MGREPKSIKLIQKTMARTVRLGIEAKGFTTFEHLVLWFPRSVQITDDLCRCSKWILGDLELTIHGVISIPIDPDEFKELAEAIGDFTSPREERAEPEPEPKKYTVKAAFA